MTRGGYTPPPVHVTMVRYHEMGGWREEEEEAHMTGLDTVEDEHGAVKTTRLTDVRSAMTQ